MRLFVLAFALLLNGASVAQKPDLWFKHINSRDGLSQGSVSSIVQDYQGFMWFGTMDGLNRYDGYTITVYRHDTSDSTSLSNDDIICLFEDSEKNLWVGTKEGLNRYDRNANKFVRYSEVGDEPIANIFEDNSGDLWVTMDSDIFLLDKDDNRFRQREHSRIDLTIQNFFQDRKDRFWVAMDRDVYIYDKEMQSYVPFHYEGDHRIPDPTIRLNAPEDFLEDSSGNFWIATLGEGLVRYDPESKQIKQQYKHKSDNPNSLPGNALMCLVQDRDNNIWIGTQNEGLSIFVPDQNQFYNYRSNNLDPHSLSFNTINTIYRDKNDNLWLGTHNKGVNLMIKRKFSHFYANSLDYTGLSDNNVTSFAEDEEGNIWIGTDGGGLNVLDRASGQFRHLKHDPTNPKSLSNNVVTYVLRDSNDNLWIGYWDGGLDKMPAEPANPVRYRHSETDSSSLRQNSILYLYEDNRANLWVATLHGLDLFDQASQTFRHIDLGSGLDEYVASMVEDTEGNLWVGTWNGLKLLDRSTAAVTHFKNDAANELSLSDNKIYVVFEDSNKRLWIGTAHGLNLLDKRSMTFKQYHLSDGLPSEAIYGILESENGDFWLSTGNGLCRFNPDRGTFKNFDVSDGLQDKEFKLNAFLKLKSGELIFGGGNGFNLFDPNEIEEETKIPPVVLTDFKIFNKSVEIGGPEAILNQSISLTKKITLSYKHSVFSIDFAAFDYVAPEQTQYAFKLEGFNKEWTYAGNRRTAAYTNLDPGIYTFKVRASSNEGHWNEEGASLVIEIVPPFWETGWFRLLAAILLAGMVFFIVRLRTYKARKHREELERKVREQTRELRAARNKAIAASKSKSEFLANMSHEIRTPMNGIIGMAELAFEADPNERQKEYLNMIIQSSDTLMAIINDILDFSKIEAGKLRLDPIAFNLVELVENVLASFSVKADELDVELLSKLADVPTWVIADPIRLRQVMTNLIGNALKFTSKGEILVTVEQESSSDDGNGTVLHFKVRDTGIGIPPEKVDMIFESFSQADTSTTRKYGGTGLGLTISQRLVQMMGGEIWVESEVNVGSTFHFTISCAATEDRQDAVNSTREQDSLDGVHFLVVDDNETNCILLHDLLTNRGATVTVASGGYEGLEKAASTNFSVILLDHQMPGIDGLEFAERFRKNNPERAGTHIVMLSSIADMTIADKQQTGINGYLTKPLRRKELWEVISHVLEKDRQHTVRKAPESRQPEKSTSVKKVLLAEDVKANQVVARHMFARFGLTLEFADDGQQALNMLRTTRYDVVFMDIQMPHADGYEVTRELRKSADHINHNVPVIAMTANAMSSDRERCIDAGMDDYISKPIKMKDLEEKIHRWILTGEQLHVEQPKHA